MAEPGKESGTDKYEYFRGLTLEQIKAHLDELTEGFGEVKKHYTGPLGRRRTEIREEDMGKILGAFGDFLPMTTNPDVQQEAVEAFGIETERPEDLTINRITGLTQEVMLFAAGFKNSGIKAMRIDGPIA
jgi:hypothetical protein